MFAAGVFFIQTWTQITVAGLAQTPPFTGFGFGADGAPSQKFIFFGAHFSLQTKPESSCSPAQGECFELCCVVMGVSSLEMKEYVAP